MNTYIESVDDWKYTDECPECGGSVFKYFDMSNYIYSIGCAKTKNCLDISVKNRTFIWSKNKKYCGWKEKFKVKKPKSILNPIKQKSENTKKIKTIQEINKKLEDDLKFHFSYLKVSKNQSTLQIIELLVKNKLKREPRKIYYFVTAGPYLKISHYEKILDYEKRIFSEPIIDRSIKLKPKSQQVPIKKIVKNFIPEVEIIDYDIEKDDEELLSSESSENEYDEEENENGSEKYETTDDDDDNYNIRDEDDEDSDVDELCDEINENFNITSDQEDFNDDFDEDDFGDDDT